MMMMSIGTSRRAKERTRSIKLHTWGEKLKKIEHRFVVCWQQISWSEEEENTPKRGQARMKMYFKAWNRLKSWSIRKQSNYIPKSVGGFGAVGDCYDKRLLQAKQESAESWEWEEEEEGELDAEEDGSVFVCWCVCRVCAWCSSAISGRTFREEKQMTKKKTTTIILKEGWLHRLETIDSWIQESIVSLPYTMSKLSVELSNEEHKQTDDCSKTKND